MKNKKKILILAAIFSASLASAQPKLEIAQGERDTVTSSRHYIVCITEPGNRAEINGVAVPVYRTGAFGTEMRLNEGANKVSVKVSNGKEQTVKDFTVVYSTAKKAVERRYTLEEARKQLAENTLVECSETVETIEGAYLQYGYEGDRLGGSKMGYLEPGIVLKAVGRIRDLYKVQLSSNRFAYIPKEYVKESSGDFTAVNTGSISVSNGGSFDRIFISLPKRVPYAYTTKQDPTEIDIDIFGAMNNSNWVTQSSDLGMIEFADVQQTDSDVFRVAIRLKEKYSWGFSVSYSGNNLVITVRHSPALTLKGMKIGLDAGHGGPESLGAVSVTGIHEADVNLSIVYEIKKILESKGAVVTLSRTGDYGVDMAERKRIFREADVDLMVSVHNNAGGSPIKPMGTSTYYKYITNRELSSCLLKRMIELKVPNYGLTGNFNFSLGGATEYPNALVECMFMSSLPDEDKLADPAFLKSIAVKVVAGIEDYVEKVAKANAASKKK